MHIRPGHRRRPHRNPRDATLAMNHDDDWQTGDGDLEEDWSVEDPDDDFDYDEFVEREFGGGVQTGLAWYWKVVVLILLAGFVLASVFPLI